MAKEIYKQLNKVAFWICLIISVALIITSFFIPPLAVIDASVLASVGELFAFATLGTVIQAIYKGSDITFNKGDINVTVNNPDNKEKSEKN